MSLTRRRYHPRMPAGSSDRLGRIPKTRSSRSDRSNPHLRPIARGVPFHCRPYGPATATRGLSNGDSTVCHLRSASDHRHLDARPAASTSRSSEGARERRQRESPPLRTPTTIGARFATRCPPTIPLATDRPPSLELRDTLSPQMMRRRRFAHAGSGRCRFRRAQTTIESDAASQPGGRRGGLRPNWGDTETVNRLQGGTQR
jgi:hypothetical protein